MSSNLDSVFVTGGAGFIGTHLLRELAESNAFGIGKKTLISGDIAKPTSTVQGVDYRTIDVRKPIAISEKIDTIFNLAAVHRTPGHLDNEYYDTNIIGAINVTEFARRHDVKTIVFTSSISTYGPGENEKHEGSELRPVSAYGKSKSFAEEMHLAWLNEDSGRRLIIIRPAVTFGLGENGNFDRLLNAMRQHRFVFPGRTDTIKSCGHVSDLVGSMLWALTLNERETTYNFCYPERTTIKEIANTVAEAFGLAKPRINVPLSLMRSAVKPFDVLDNVGIKTGINTARIMKLVESTNVVPSFLVRRGYPFRTDLKSGIQVWARSLETINLRQANHESVKL